MSSNYEEYGSQGGVPTPLPLNILEQFVMRAQELEPSLHDEAKAGHLCSIRSILLFLTLTIWYEKKIHVESYFSSLQLTILQR